MLLLTLVSILAFYLAWNLGANDVANSMGTAVGSKAITLKQALIVASILELAGALLLGSRVSTTLATQIIHLELLQENSADFVVGMIVVSLASGIWLNIATVLGLPVSSSHAVVGAIAGFGWIAMGVTGVAWSVIGTITLSWMATPLVSGAIAAFCNLFVRRFLLNDLNSSFRFNEWIPWLNTLLVTVFGFLILPAVAQPIHQLILTHVNILIPSHTISLLMGAIALTSLNLFTWKFSASTPLRQFVPLQLLSACLVAFAHGSNDVGNAIAPLAAIVFTLTQHRLPTEAFQLPFWVLSLGAVGIVAGLAIWGEKVINTVGQGILPLQPSSGFCAQFGAAVTVLVASQLGLPVSTSHAIVGGVVGIGLTEDLQQIRYKTLRDIGLVWVVTIPASILLSALFFSVWRYFF